MKLPLEQRERKKGITTHKVEIKIVSPSTQLLNQSHMITRTTICKEVTTSHQARQLISTGGPRIIKKIRCRIIILAKEPHNLNSDHREFHPIHVRMFTRQERILHC